MHSSEATYLMIYFVFLHKITNFRDVQTFVHAVQYMT